jgi:hypothetical protein
MVVEEVEQQVEVNSNQENIFASQLLQKEGKGVGVN